MIAVHATLRVMPQDGPAFEDIVTGLKALVREREPAVLFYQLCRSQTAPGTYHMMELYADDAARAAHEETDWFLEAAPRFKALLVDDPKIETYDAL